MVIVMNEHATEDQIEKVIAALTQKGYDAHRSTGTTRTVVGVVGHSKIPLDPREFEILPGVHEVVKITEPYKLAGRTFQPQDTVIRIGDVEIGGRDIVMMAGPCAVESEKQLDIIAASVSRYGARVLRGGAFKPRTSPYTFQGLGEEGLRYLRAVADRHGLLVVTEVMDTSQVDQVAEYADILQVGARNMQNFNLLKDLGRQKKAVMLKRGMSATIQEWLLSAEYIMAGLLRARHPHLRELHPQHHGYFGDPDHQEAEPSADHRRPESRDRPAGQGDPDGPGGGGGRRRRHHGRGAPRARGRPLGRPPIDLPRAVRRADGAAAHHRSGDRPDDRLGLSGGPVRRLSIIGLGLIGGSIGLAARRGRTGLGVIGFDRPSILRKARRRGVIDVAAPNLAAAVRETDLIVLALPVDAILSILPRIGRLAPSGSVITDVGSTKRSIMAAARRAGLGARFVGGHPMAGSDRSGVEHAEAGLFEGAPWILCTDGTARASLARVAAMARRLGARPVQETARRHDELVARLSHLPQIASVALVNAAVRSRIAASAVGLSGPAFRQIGRLARSSPRLWDGILKTNRVPVASALKDLERELRRLRTFLARGVGGDFRRAARVVGRLGRGRAGGRC